MAQPWEYRMVSGGYDAHKVLEIASTLGAEGWELVVVIPADTGTKPPGVHLIFKRPVEPGEPP